MFGVADLQGGQAGVLDAVVAGPDFHLANHSVLQFGGLGGRDNGDFVEAVMAVDDQHMATAQGVHDLGQGQDQFRRKHAQHLVGRGRRVGQGAEQVEQGAQP